MSVIETAYPERLTMARHLRGLTQAELSAVTGVSHGLISKYENDIKPISEQHVSIFASVLHLPDKFFYTPMPSKKQVLRINLTL